MKSTFASGLQTGNLDSNPAVAGRALHSVRGHRPWLRASPAIDLRFVLDSTPVVATYQWLFSSAPLETAYRAASLPRD